MAASWADITGRGVVSSAGLDMETFDQSILTGRDCIGLLDPEMRNGLRFSMGSPVSGFDPAAHFDAKAISTLDIFSQFATVAARQAWAEAGLESNDTPGERIGVIVGTANAGINVLQEGWHRILREDRKPIPMTIPMTMGSAPASRIAREIGARGPVFGVTSACASAAHAVLLGLMMVRSGLADIMMVGGTDHCYVSGYLSAWEVLRVVSPDTCRPFSKNRSGMIIGEGAAMVVIESPAHARERGAAVCGHLLGGAMTSDADNLTTPNGEGMAAAILAALTDARLAPNDIEYINAHGTGTALNDKLEAAAIRTAFGAHTGSIAVSSTKSAFGHAMGASGALELLATLAALQHQIAPPTLHYAEVDPLCELDVVPEGPRPLPMDHALSNSFAFGGLNVTLAVARPGCVSKDFRLAISPTAEPVRITRVETKQQRELFLRVLDRVQGDDPTWVPPLRVMEERRLSPKHNPFFTFGEAALFVAQRGAALIGRISAQVNRRHQELYPGEGHFGFFDCLDDSEAAQALVAAAANWLRAKNCTRMLGPMNFTINDECGLQVEGFESDPAVFMTQARTWTGSLLETAGLTKDMDLFAYRMRPSQADDKVRRLAKLAHDSARVKIRAADMKRYDQELATLVDIFNDAWSGNWGFTPISVPEMNVIVGELRHFYKGNLARIVELDGEPVGVMVALPNYNEVVKGLHGRLFPFNWAKLLWRLWRNDIASARVILLGLRASVRNGPLGAGMLAMLVDAFVEEARRYKIDWVEFSWVLETNRAMCGLAELAAGAPAKRYRIYAKDL